MSEGKYSWEKIGSEYFIWHKEETATKFIASTDTSEKAHLLATAANAISASPPDAGKEQEAVGFAEWASREYVQYQHGKWRKPKTIVRFTTSELYTLYKQNK